RCPQAFQDRTTQLRSRLSTPASQKTHPFPVWYSRRSSQATVPRSAETASLTTASCDQTILCPARQTRRKKLVSSAPDNAKASSNLGTRLNTWVPTSTLLAAHALRVVPVADTLPAKNPPRFTQSATSESYLGNTGPEATSAVNSACAQRSSSNQ